MTYPPHANIHLVVFCFVGRLELIDPSDFSINSIVINLWSFLFGCNLIPLVVMVNDIPLVPSFDVWKNLGLLSVEF
jgi:hypothetical protein